MLFRSYLVPLAEWVRRWRRGQHLWRLRPKGVAEFFLDAFALEAQLRVVVGVLPMAAAAGEEVSAARLGAFGRGLAHLHGARAAKLARRRRDLRKHLFARQRALHQHDVAAHMGECIRAVGERLDEELTAFAVVDGDQVGASGQAALLDRSRAPGASLEARGGGGAEPSQLHPCIILPLVDLEPMPRPTSAGLVGKREALVGAGQHRDLAVERGAGCEHDAVDTDVVANHRVRQVGEVQRDRQRRARARDLTIEINLRGRTEPVLKEPLETQQLLVSSSTAQLDLEHCEVAGQRL